MNRLNYGATSQLRIWHSNALYYPALIILLYLSSFIPLPAGKFLGLRLDFFLNCVVISFVCFSKHGEHCIKDLNLSPGHQAIRSPWSSRGAPCGPSGRACRMPPPLFAAAGSRPAPAVPLFCRTLPRML